MTQSIQEQTIWIFLNIIFCIRFNHIVNRLSQSWSSFITEWIEINHIMGIFEGHNAWGTDVSRTVRYISLNLLPQTKLLTHSSHNIICILYFLIHILLKEWPRRSCLIAWCVSYAEWHFLGHLQSHIRTWCWFPLHLCIRAQWLGIGVPLWLSRNPSALSCVFNLLVHKLRVS